MRSRPLIRILIIAEMAVLLFTGLAAVHRRFTGVSPDREGVGEDVQVSGVSGDDIEDDPVETADPFIEVERPVDLIKEDGEGITGSAYDTDFPAEIIDTLEEMAVSEKAEVLFCSSRESDYLADDGEIAVIYIYSSDELIEYVRDGIECLYDADDPEEAAEELLTAVASGEILSEALDKAAGYAIIAHEKLQELMSESDGMVSEDTVSEDQAEPEADDEDAGQDTGEASEADQTGRSDSSSARRSADSASGGRKTAESTPNAPTIPSAQPDQTPQETQPSEQEQAVELTPEQLQQILLLQAQQAAEQTPQE